MRLSHLISKNSAASLSLLVSSLACAQPNYHGECFEQLYTGDSPQWLALQLMSSGERKVISDCADEKLNLQIYDRLDQKHISSQTDDKSFREETFEANQSSALLSGKEITKSEGFYTIESPTEKKREDIQTLQGYKSLSEKKPAAD